jgi:hypothetical protein
VIPIFFVVKYVLVCERSQAQKSTYYLISLMCIPRGKTTLNRYVVAWIDWEGAQEDFAYFCCAKDQIQSLARARESSTTELHPSPRKTFVMRGTLCFDYGDNIWVYVFFSINCTMHLKSVHLSYVDQKLSWFKTKEYI